MRMEEYSLSSYGGGVKKILKKYDRISTTERPLELTKYAFQ